VVVAALLAAGVVGLVDRLSFGLPVAVAAAVVLSGLAVEAAVLVCSSVSVRSS
jgi:hypothetical protein